MRGAFVSLPCFGFVARALSLAYGSLCGAVSLRPPWADTLNLVD